jgi:uncharacterized Zn-finger protein
MRKHSDEKPFVCEICGKGTKTEADLERHERIHSGYKPYACEFPGCLMRFTLNQTK